MVNISIFKIVIVFLFIKTFYKHCINISEIFVSSYKEYTTIVPILNLIADIFFCIQKMSIIK